VLLGCIAVFMLPFIGPASACSLSAIRALHDREA
jgi:hypothetical protein